MEVVVGIKPRKLTRARLINDYVVEGSGIDEEFIDQLIARAGGKLGVVQRLFNKIEKHQENCRLRGVAFSIEDFAILQNR